MVIVTILYLTPFSLDRNINREVGGKSILPSVLVVMLNKNPAISATSDLFYPSDFSDLRSSYIDMKHGLNTEVTQVTYIGKKPEQTSFQQLTTTCLFLKNRTWQTEILSHL